MTREPDQIFADILLHPELDEPRFEFAQAIERDDPAWAGYIERALVKDEFGYDSVSLPNELERRVLAPLRKLGDVNATLYRGLPDTLYVPIDVFIQKGDALLDLAPIIDVRILVDAGTPESRLNELTHCSAISRVLCLYVGSWPRFDYASYELLLKAKLDRLLWLHTPDAFCHRLPTTENELPERAMWPRLFANANFRRMLDWGLSATTHRVVGDRMRVEPAESDSWEIVTYEPMPDEDREIEQQYGYIPRLHAANWGAKVLDVLRGKKPDFPAGARPVPEMYAVPPPMRRRTTLIEY
jgi:hypothetical protein